MKNISALVVCLALLGCCQNAPFPNIRYGDRVEVFDRFYGNGKCNVDQLTSVGSTYYVHAFCTFDTGFSGTRIYKASEVRTLPGSER